MALTHETVELKNIDYKDVATLKKFVTKFNKITPRYYSGTNVKTQKKLAQAIKRARYMALMPYVLDLKQKEYVAV
jgi:small subunit ribosomal protein S18